MADEVRGERENRLQNAPTSGSPFGVTQTTSPTLTSGGTPGGAPKPKPQVGAFGQGESASKAWREKMLELRAKGAIFKDVDNPYVSPLQKSGYGPNQVAPWVRTSSGRLPQLEQEMFPKELPEGAIGWDNFGNPSYGGRTPFQESLLRMKANWKNQGQITAEQGSWDDWDAPNVSQSFQEGGIGGGVSAILQGAGEVFKQTGESIDYMLSGGNAEITPAQETWRYVSEGVGPALELLDAASYQTKLFLGGVAHVAEETFNFGHGAVDDAVHFDERWQEINDASDQFATQRKDNDAFWMKLGFSQDIIQEYKFGAMSAHMFYTNAFGGTVDLLKGRQGNDTYDFQQAEFMRRMKENPNLNPYVAVKEYYNPVLEGVGQAVFDPLNLVGWAAKGIKGGILVNKATTLMAEPLDAVKAFNAGQDVTRVSGLIEDAADIAKFDGLITARTQDLVTTIKKQTKLAKSKSVFGLTNQSKASLLATDLSATINWALGQAKTADGVIDLEKLLDIQQSLFKTAGDIEVLTKIQRGEKVSDAAMMAHKARIAEGVQDLSRFPGWDVAFTEPGTHAALYMNDILSNGKLKKVADLLQKGDIEDASKLMDSMLVEGTKKLFPDVADDLNKAGSGYKIIAKTHDWMQTKGPYKYFNKFFSNVYLGLNPGFAARNFMQNTVQTVLDEGIRGVVGFNSLDNIVAWNGGTAAPFGSVMDFGTAVAGEGGKKVNAVDILGAKIPTVGSNLAGSFERSAGLHIYNKVFPDTMKKLLKKGASEQQLVKYGFTKAEAQNFLDLLIQKKGNYDEVFTVLEKEYKQGWMDIGRTHLGWDDDMVKWADETGFGDNIMQIMSDSDSVDDAVREIESMFQQAWDAGDGVIDDIPTLGPDDIGAEAAVIDSTKYDQFGGGKEVQTVILENNHYMGANTRVWDTGREITETYRDTLAQQLVDEGLVPDINTAYRMFDESITDVTIDGTNWKLQDLVGDGRARSQVDNYVNGVKGDTLEDLRLLRGTTETPEKIAMGVKLHKKWNLGEFIGAIPAEPTRKWVSEQVYPAIWRAERKRVRGAFQAYRDAAAVGYKQITNKFMDVANQLSGSKGIVYQAPIWDEMANALDKARIMDGFLDSRDITGIIDKALVDGNRVGMAVGYAKMYKLPIYTNSGYFFDDALLKILNKRLGQNFKKLSDLNNSATIGPVQIQAALMSHALGETMEVYQTVGRKGFAALEKVVAEGLDNLDPDDITAISKTLDVVANHDPDLAKAIEKIYKERDFHLKEMARKGNRMSPVTKQEAQNIVGELEAKMDDLVGEAKKVLEDNRALEAPEWITKKAGQYSPEDIEEAMNLVKDVDEDLYKALAQADAARGMAGSRQLEDVEQFYNIDPHDLSLDANLKATADAVKKADKAVEKEMAKVKKLVGPQPDDFKLSKKLMQDQVEALKEKGVFKPDMAYFSGENMPTTPRQWYELRPALKQMKPKFTEMAKNNFGKRQKITDGATRITQLKKARKYVGNMVEESRLVANKVAKAKRDFILLDYGKRRNLDLAMSYVMPYHFWYNRTYYNWLQRTVTHPGTFASYARYKRVLEEVHAGAPDWWKNQFNTNELLGLDSENPFYFNLEAMFNPLNGLTGEPFDDRDKRYDWLSGIVQDIGKFGPSVYTPIAWAMAFRAYQQGEEQATAKWTGRVIPQTQAVKALTALLGMGPGGSGLEIDPGIWLTQHGLDVWESRRIGRALGWAVDAGELTKEQAQQAAIEGPGNEHFDQARGVAQSKRSLGQITGFFGGVGLKGRSKEDLEIDKFDEEYQRFRVMRDGGDMTEQEIYDAYQYFDQKYPFYSTLQIARRDGDERDSSYAYSVLRRVPPGATSETYAAMGISRDQMQEFFDEGGIPKDWSERERDDFNYAVQDLGTMLAIPDGATQDEWQEVRLRNDTLYDTAEQKFGEDVVGLVDAYWKLYGSDPEAAKQLRNRNPVINEYQDYLSLAKINDPLLAKYYGSFDNLSYIAKGNVYEKLDAKYGPEYDVVYSTYQEMKLSDPKAAAKFYKEHPEIKEYGKDKAYYKALEAERLIMWGDRLPEREAAPEWRPDIPQPEAMSPQQQQIYSGFGAEAQPEYYRFDRKEWEAYMSPAMINLVEDYALRNEELSYQAENSLEYQLRDLDIDIDLAKQLIRAAFQGRRGG